MDIIINAQRELFNNAISLYFAIDDGRNTVAAEPAIFSPIEDGSYRRTFLSLKIKDAQSLMDQLWDCGLRPSEGSGSAGSLRANERHLADMQRISFDLLARSLSARPAPPVSSDPP